MALAPKTKDAILSSMLGKSQQVSIAPTCYIGLFLSVPTITTEPTMSPEGSIIPVGTILYTEPSEETGYTRSQIGNYQNSTGNAMETPADGICTNKSPIFFPEAVTTWGTIAAFGLFNAQTGGTPFLWGTLSQSITIPANYIPLFRAGSLTVKLS